MVSWGSQIIDPARPRGSSLVGRFTAWCHHLQVDRLWFCPGGDRHGWVLWTHRFLRAFLFLRRKESRRAKLLWPYIDNIIYNVYTYLHTYIHTDRQTDRHTYRIYPVTYRIYTYNIHIHSWFFMWGWLDLQTWKCWPLRMGTYIRRKKVPCGLRGGSYFKSEWINILLEQTSWSAIRRVIHRKPVRSLRGEGCSS